VSVQEKTIVSDGSECNAEKLVEANTGGCDDVEPIIQPSIIFVEISSSNRFIYWLRLSNLAML